MERIKVAVEKAREQAAAQQLPAGNEALKTVESPFEKDFPTINYSKTKIVELDLEHLERHRIVAYNKSHPSNWMFDLLRTRVLQRMVENGWRTLAVTSPSPEAGKTVVSINLAMSIAHQTRHTALLVDFDLRRPKVGNYLGIETDVSLNDVLTGDADVSDVMINPNLPRLVVVPTKRPVEKPSEMLSSKRAERIITDLRGRYDERIVIFDLPPLLAADDAIAILPKIDCVLLVVGNGMSTEREIKDSLRHLAEANLLGLVMNKAELPTKNNYY